MTEQEQNHWASKEGLEAISIMGWPNAPKVEIGGQLIGSELAWGYEHWSIVERVKNEFWDGWSIHSRFATAILNQWAIDWLKQQWGAIGIRVTDKGSKVLKFHMVEGWCFQEETDTLARALILAVLGNEKNDFNYLNQLETKEQSK